MNFELDLKLRKELEEICEQTAIPMSAVIRRGIVREIQGLKNTMAGVVSQEDIDNLKATVQEALSDLGVVAMREEVAEMYAQGKRLILIDVNDRKAVEAAGGTEAETFHVDPETGDLKLGPRPDENTNA